MMQTTPNQDEIGEALGRCQEAFARFTAVVDTDLPSAGMDTLHAVWAGYYFHAFRQYDELLRAQSGLGEHLGPSLSVSISHHNLHRLIEVLRLELGDRPLGATRSQERLADLAHSCHKLRDLLAAEANQRKYD